MPQDSMYVIFMQWQEWRKGGAWWQRSSCDCEQAASGVLGWGQAVWNSGFSHCLWLLHPQIKVTRAPETAWPPLLTQLPTKVHHGKQQVIVQELGSIQPTWQTWMESPTAWLQINPSCYGHWGSESSDANFILSLSVFLPLPLSVFQIIIKKKTD